MSDDTPPKHVVNINPPWSGAVFRAGKRIENRKSRPPEKIVGERIAVYATNEIDEEAMRHVVGVEELHGGVWEPEYQPLMDATSEGDLSSENNGGCIVGTVRVVGWWDDSVDEHRTNEYGARKRIHGEGYHVGLDVATTDAKPDMMPNEAPEDPWWLDSTDCGWLLSDPTPIDPIPVDGSHVLPGVWELPDEVREQIGGRDE